MSCAPRNGIALTRTPHSGGICAVIFCVFFILFILPAPAAANDAEGRIIWVWGTDAALLFDTTPSPTHDAAWQPLVNDLLDFCTIRSIDTIQIFIPWLTTVDSPALAYVRTNFAEFTRLADSQGLRVVVMYTNNTWYSKADSVAFKDTAAGYASEVNDALGSLITAGAIIKGFNYDLEPHQMADWNTYMRQYAVNLVTIYRLTNDTVQARGLQMCGDVPAWWDETGPDTLNFSIDGGPTKRLVYHLLDHADVVNCMAYIGNDSQGLLARISNEMDTGGGVSRIRLVQECDPSIVEGVSQIGVTSLVYLLRNIITVRAAYPGIAIGFQQYDSLRRFKYTRGSPTGKGILRGGIDTVSWNPAKDTVLPGDSSTITVTVDFYYYPHDAAHNDDTTTCRTNAAITSGDSGTMAILLPLGNHDLYTNWTVRDSERIGRSSSSQQVVLSVTLTSTQRAAWEDAGGEIRLVMFQGTDTSLADAAIDGRRETYAFLGVTVSVVVDLEARAIEAGCTATLSNGFDTFTQASNDSGTAVFAGVLAGSYRLTVKEPHHLRRTITSVSIGGSDTTVTVGILKGGDSNDDNRINIFDGGIIRFLLGRVFTAADIDGSGSVTTSDLSYVRTNFGLRGDEP